MDTYNKLRVRFRKCGSLKFISHLDMARTFKEAFFRAGVPLKYSEGMSPRPKLVFTPPLSLCLESECELLDIASTMSADEVFALITPQFTEEMRIAAVYTPSSALGDIHSAEYRIIVEDKLDVASLQTALAAPLPFEKTGKSGVRTVDLQDYIVRSGVMEDGEKVTITAVLLANQQNYLAPEPLLRTLAEKIGAFVENYTMCRGRFFAANGSEFN